MIINLYQCLFYTYACTTPCIISLSVKSCQHVVSRHQGSTERATLVKEYVTAMKTVKQRNMMKREMKLAIGE